MKKSAQKNVVNGMGALSSTGSSFGTAAASTRLDQHPTNGSQAAFIDDVLKQQALAEEEAVLNQYKVLSIERYYFIGDFPFR